MSDTQTIHELREGIQSTRNHMTQTVHQLEDRVVELKDWRTAVARFPLVSLGVAIGAGVVIAGAGRPLAKMGLQYAKGALLTSIGVALSKQFSHR